MNPPERPTLAADSTFSVVPTWVLDAAVSASAVRLYAVLARYANSAGTCWPSRRTLAARMQVRSADTVDRALRELVAVGAVTVQHRRDESGAPTASLYRLHVVPAGVAANLRPPSRTDAAGVAAPLRHRTRTIEREDPQPPARGAGGDDPAHHGQHRRCRACGTSPRQQAEQQRAAAAVRPPWCGECDEPTRMVQGEAANGTPLLSRCPTCHPLERTA